MFATKWPVSRAATFWVTNMKKNHDLFFVCARFADMYSWCCTLFCCPQQICLSLLSIYLNSCPMCLCLFYWSALYECRYHTGTDFNFFKNKYYWQLAWVEGLDLCVFCQKEMLCRCQNAALELKIHWQQLQQLCDILKNKMHKKVTHFFEQVQNSRNRNAESLRLTQRSWALLRNRDFIEKLSDDCCTDDIFSRTQHWFMKKCE